MYNSTTDAEVLDGIFGALDTREFVFVWLMGLADALRCVCAFLYQPPVLALGQLWRIDSSSITPKLVRRNQNAQKTRTTAPSLRTQLPLILTVQVTFTHNRHRRRTSCLRLSISLSAQLTMPHRALPPRTAFLLFSGHNDSCTMSALAR